MEAIETQLAKACDYKNEDEMTDTRFSPAAMAMQSEWVALAKDYLNDRITKAEFEKRKLRLELKGLKIEKTHKAGEVPESVQAAVKVLNGSAIQVEEEPHGAEKGCKID